MEDQQASFHLVKGAGPIYLSGTHQTETAVIGEDDIEFDESHGDEEGEDEEDEDDEVDEMPVSYLFTINWHIPYTCKRKALLVYCFWSPPSSLSLSFFLPPSLPCV